MMWLERIDPRLPKKFSATFAHQMVYNTSLRDLPPIISACLPSLLQELDETAANCACLHVVNADGQTPTVAAASFPRQNSRFRGQRRFQSAKPKSSGKFRRICFLLNKNSPNIYTSHTITICSNLFDRDKQEMSRVAAITLDDESNDPDTPTPRVQSWPASAL